MKTQHTPGPWKDDGMEFIMDANGFAICQARDFDSWEANARLIAAAPEMLAALQKIVTANANYDDLTQPMLEAEAAIAKATAADQ